MTYTVAAARDMRARFATDLSERTAASRLEFRTINGLSAPDHSVLRAGTMRPHGLFELVHRTRGTLASLVGELFRA